MYRQLLRNYLRCAKLHCDFGDPGFSVSDTVVKTLRPLSYVEQWSTVIQKRWYHVRLPDHSFFLFDVHGHPRYSFYDRPINALTIEEYIAGQGEEVTAKAIREYEREYISDYLPTAGLRDNWTQIRYDFDPVSYRPGVHPAGHVHLGSENHIRIGVRRELTPEAFFLFVMRQMYPLHWERLISSVNVGSIEKRIREQLRELGEHLYTSLDNTEMYLQ